LVFKVYFKKIISARINPDFCLMFLGHLFYILVSGEYLKGSDMGSKRLRKKTTNLEDEAHALLSAKAESTGISKQELASKYISIGVSYNLQDPDWEERIKKKWQS